MKRIAATCAMAAFLLSLSACGGGPELGVPADAGPPKQFDMKNKLEKMKEVMQAKPKTSNVYQGQKKEAPKTKESPAAAPGEP